jgi:hypothetical protein
MGDRSSFTSNYRPFKPASKKRPALAQLIGLRTRAARV